MHGAQQVCQHVVGFDFQMIGFELNRHMAVAQVVGGADQIEWCAVLAAMDYAQHGLRRRDDANERAVFSDQHVTTPRHRAARQEDAKAATL